MEEHNLKTSLGTSSSFQKSKNLAYGTEMDALLKDFTREVIKSMNLEELEFLKDLVQNNLVTLHTYTLKKIYNMCQKAPNSKNDFTRQLKYSWTNSLVNVIEKELEKRHNERKGKVKPRSA